MDFDEPRERKPSRFVPKPPKKRPRFNEGVKQGADQDPGGTCQETAILDARDQRPILIDSSKLGPDQESRGTSQETAILSPAGDQRPRLDDSAKQGILEEQGLEIKVSRKQLTTKVGFSEPVLMLKQKTFTRSETGRLRTSNEDGERSADFCIQETRKESHLDKQIFTERVPPAVMSSEDLLELDNAIHSSEGAASTKHVESGRIFGTRDRTKVVEKSSGFPLSAVPVVSSSRTTTFNKNIPDKEPNAPLYTSGLQPTVSAELKQETIIRLVTNASNVSEKSPDPTPKTNPTVSGCTRIGLQLDPKPIMVRFTEESEKDTTYAFDGFGIEENVKYIPFDLPWWSKSPKEFDEFFKTLTLDRDKSSISFVLPHGVPLHIFRKLSTVATPYFSFVDVVEQPTALAVGFRAVNSRIFEDLSKTRTILFVSAKTTRDEVQFSVAKFKYHEIEVLAAFRKSRLTLKDDSKIILTNLLQRADIIPSDEIEFCFSRHLDPNEELNKSLKSVFGDRDIDTHIYASHAIAQGAAILNCMKCMTRIPWSQWFDEGVLELAKLKVIDRLETRCIVCFDHMFAENDIFRCTRCESCDIHFTCLRNHGCPSCHHRESMITPDGTRVTFVRPQFEDLSHVAFMGNFFM